MAWQIRLSACRLSVVCRLKTAEGDGQTGESIAYRRLYHQVTIGYLISW